MSQNVPLYAKSAARGSLKAKAPSQLTQSEMRVFIWSTRGVFHQLASSELGALEKVWAVVPLPTDVTTCLQSG